MPFPQFSFFVLIFAPVAPQHFAASLCNKTQKASMQMAAMLSFAKKEKKILPPP